MAGGSRRFSPRILLLLGSVLRILPRNQQPWSRRVQTPRLLHEAPAEFCSESTSVSLFEGCLDAPALSVEASVLRTCAKSTSVSAWSVVRLFLTFPVSAWNVIRILLGIDNSLSALCASGGSCTESLAELSISVFRRLRTLVSSALSMSCPDATAWSVLRIRPRGGTPVWLMYEMMQM